MIKKKKKNDKNKNCIIVMLTIAVLRMIGGR